MKNIIRICLITIFDLFSDDLSRRRYEHEQKKEAYREHNKYRMVVVVKCGKTEIRYPVWRDLLPKLKKDWCCPQCGKFIYRKNELNKHEVDETNIKRYILNKCKHKFVQDVMKSEVFGFDYHSVQRVLIKYDTVAVAGRKGEYESICKNCRRYMRYLQGEMNLEDEPEKHEDETDFYDDEKEW